MTVNEAAENHRVCDRGLTRAFAFLGKRWNGVIMGTLGSGPAGFAELVRAIPGISESVLSDRLGELTRADLVKRTVREGPPVDVPDEALLFRIIRGSFQMRRKTLLNTLEAALDLPKVTIERLSRQARIDPARRGETLTLEEFARLARAAADRLA